MGFIFSIAQGMTEGVLVPTVVVVGEVIFRRVLKGDPSASSSPRSLESALGAISTPPLPGPPP
jgi:hypothetical protein